MDNSKNSPLLLGIGIGVGIGGVLALILVLMLGATPKNIKVGPVEFEIPTATPPTVQPTSVQQVAQQPTTSSKLATSIPKVLPTVPPTSTPIPPPPTQVRFVTTFEVFANLSWQDTRVQIKSGDALRIIWDGKSKWRGANFGDFSDPLGGWNDPNANYACPPLAPSNEVGWNALVAKIGVNGVPTNPFKVLPKGEGSLFLAMNDCDKERYDNSGSVIVTIEISR